MPYSACPIWSHAVNLASDRRLPSDRAHSSPSTLQLGEKVALVPYLPEHVPKYHEWMQSPHLQGMVQLAVSH